MRKPLLAKKKKKRKKKTNKLNVFALHYFPFNLEKLGSIEHGAQLKSVRGR